MNEQLIEEIMAKVLKASRIDGDDVQLNITRLVPILNKHLSDKLIIDKKVLEGLVEKRKNIYKSNPFKENTGTTEKKIIEDLKSLQEPTEQQGADVDEIECENCKRLQRMLDGISFSM